MEIILSNIIAFFSIYSGVRGLMKRKNITVSIFYISIVIIILIFNFKFT